MDIGSIVAVNKFYIHCDNYKNAPDRKSRRLIKKEYKDVLAILKAEARRNKTNNNELLIINDHLKKCKELIDEIISGK